MDKVIFINKCVFPEQNNGRNTVLFPLVRAGGVMLVPFRMNYLCVCVCICMCVCVFHLTLHLSSRSVFGSHAAAAGSNFHPLVFIRGCTKHRFPSGASPQMTLDMKWVGVGGCEEEVCRGEGLGFSFEMWRWLCVWEEIIKLQTLEMRLLWRPRQSSLFLLTVALCSLMAIIETVMARHQMTFPLVLWRGRAPFTCVLPLFLFLYCSTLWPPSTCSYPWRRWKRCLWISRWVIAFIYAQRCCVHFFLPGRSSWGHSAPDGELCTLTSQCKWLTVLCITNKWHLSPPRS